MFKCAGYAQWNVAISLHIHIRIQCSCDDAQRNNGAIILADTIADCELATNADSFCCVCDTGSITTMHQAAQFNRFHVIIYESLIDATHVPLFTVIVNES